ncbi:hypothetical protein Tco_0542222 [Tanacetum coccineum]
MTTLAGHIIAGAENRPPMLKKSMYDSWASRIRLFIKGKKHDRMMLDLIENDDCDVQATKIILHGLPPDVYALINHHEVAKAIWDKVKLLMKDTELSYQERECRLYDLFDKFDFSVTQQSQAEFPRLDSGLAVPMFQQGEDSIECVNKAMAFLSAIASRREYGKTVYSAKEAMKCCMVYGEGNTIPQNAAFQTEDLDAYDSDCDDLSSAKEILMANLSSCDSDVLTEVPYSDSFPNDMLNQDAQAMTYFEQTHIVDSPDNEIHIDSNIIPYSQYLQEIQDAGIQDTNSSAPNDLLILSLVEQMTDQVANLDKENQTNKMVNESSSAELKRYKERVAIFEQRQNVDLNTREKLIDSQMDDIIRTKNAKLEAFKQEIDTLKETLSNNVKEKESLSTALNVFKTASKEKEYNYIDEEIVLEKHNKELENILCKLYRSTQAMYMLTKPQVFYDDTQKQALGY